MTGGFGRIEVAKRRLARRIPKRRLGTTGLGRRLGMTGGCGRIEVCQAALGETHSQAALGNDRVGGAFFRTLRLLSGGDSGYFHLARLHSFRMFGFARARDENSGMTRLGGDFGFVGGGEAPSGAWREAFPSGAWERQGTGLGGAFFRTLRLLSGGIPDIFISRGCIRFGCLDLRAREMKIPE